MCYSFVIFVIQGVIALLLMQILPSMHLIISLYHDNCVAYISQIQIIIILIHNVLLFYYCHWDKSGSSQALLILGTDNSFGEHYDLLL